MSTAAFRWLVCTAFRFLPTTRKANFQEGNSAATYLATTTANSSNAVSIQAPLFHRVLGTPYLNYCAIFKDCGSFLVILAFEYLVAAWYAGGPKELASTIKRRNNPAVNATRPPLCHTGAV
jgi:predicted permease